NKHAITHEYIRMGALKGKIVNDDGTVLVDLYVVFGVTKKVITIPLSAPETEVREFCHKIKRHIEQNLLGDVMSHVECWCSAEFFDALVKHPTVKDAFRNYESASDRLGGDVRRDFTFGGVKFSEYEAAAPDREGNPRKFIDKDMAHAFPMGTKDTFEIVYAPPVLNGINQANTRGVELYAVQVPDPLGRWIDTHSESDPLPLCRHPGVLVEVTHS
ncbi:MAG: major capsid protein, partial [Gammaproteobacteria bacterium]|nr:major capsid protein [Gammaproteobacteria bacterium]